MSLCAAVRPFSQPATAFIFDPPEKAENGTVRTSMKPNKDGAGRSPGPITVQLDLRLESEAEQKITPEQQIKDILKKHPGGANRKTVISAMNGTKTEERETPASTTVAQLILRGEVVERTLGRQQL